LLCEADMNSFDAKINTENLTKCLQTLKQFYADLYKDKVQLLIHVFVDCICLVKMRCFKTKLCSYGRVEAEDLAA